LKNREVNEMTDTNRELEKTEVATPAGVERTREVPVYTPRVDIYERENDLVVVADMPGVDAEHLDITLENNVLTIHGKVEPEQHAGYSLAHAEYGVGDYYRTFTISDEINRDGIQANIKNGVLNLVLPKAEKARARKIEVKAA